MSASVAGFAFCRVLLGLGEAAIFPGSVRSIAEWFPQRERAFATGLFNAGTNVGALATPIVVPIIALRYGWYWAFIGTGLLGFLWLGVWLWQYMTPRTHPGVNAAELAIIESDPPDGAAFKVPGLAMAGIVAAVCFVSGTVAATFFGARLIAVALFATGLITAIILNPRRQVWAYAVGKFMTDPVWWLYLTWLPDFLVKAHHVDIRGAMLPLATIYLVADVGSVLGGYLSSKLIQRGFTVNAARKLTMLTFAMSVTPIVFAAQVDSLWGAVALVSIAASGPPGVERQPLHAGERHVSAACRRQCHRLRRHDGGVWWRDHADRGRRLARRLEQQLRADLHRGRHALPARAGRHPPARADDDPRES